MRFLTTKNWKLKTSPRLHSDLMYVAYFYTHKLYDKLVNEGEMK